MNLVEVGRAGLNGFLYTLVGISLTLTLGLTLGRLLRTERTTRLGS